MFRWYCANGTYDIVFSDANDQFVARETGVPMFEASGVYDDLSASTGAALVGATSGTVQASLNARPTSATLAASGGSALSGFIASGTGAQATNIENKLRRFVDVLDFIPANLHAGIKDGTNATDLTAYIQAAIDAVIADGVGGDLYFPGGDYKTTGSLEVSNASKVNLFGAGSFTTRILSNNVGEPIVRLLNASSNTQNNGENFDWRGIQFRYSVQASGSDTNAIGISFEEGTGDRSFGYFNFTLTDIQVVSAYISISNDWGAGDPPNVWGWSWNSVRISDFAKRCVYLTNGGVGGFPNCHIGSIYIQGRPATTYTDAPFFCDSPDSWLIESLEWNIGTLNSDAFISFSGSARAVTVTTARFETIGFTTGALQALFFTNNGALNLGSISVSGCTMGAGVTAGIFRLASPARASIAVTYVDNVTGTGALLTWIADANGLVGFVGPQSPSAGQWVAGEGGFGSSILLLRSDGLSVLGNKVVGARGAAIPDATGGATVDTEARAAINALLAFFRGWGSIAT